MVQQNPQSLPLLLQQLGQANPQLLQVRYNVTIFLITCEKNTVHVRKQKLAFLLKLSHSLSAALFERPSFYV